MSSQHMSFHVRGVGGGRGPTSRPHVAVLHAYVNNMASKKKKKKDKDDDA